MNKKVLKNVYTKCVNGNLDYTERYRTANTVTALVPAEPQE